jgi:hypothetical protein
MGQFASSVGHTKITRPRPEARFISGAAYLLAEAEESGFPPALGAW